MSRSQSKAKSDFIFHIVVFVLVTAVNIALLCFHETWRDEAQAWLIARDTDPLSLFGVLPYEGHPFLWYYLIMPFAKLGLPFRAVSVVNLLVMETALYLFLRYSPFHKFANAVLAFSPLFVYFLPVIARCYSLSALLIIIAAILHRSRMERPIAFGVTLALLLQTHIIVSTMVFILALFWLIDVIKSCRIEREKAVRRFIGLSLPLLSALFLLFELRNSFQASVLSEDGGLIADHPHKYLIAGGGLLAAAVAVGLLRLLIKDARIYRMVVVLAVSLTAPVLTHLFILPLIQARKILCLYMVVFCLWQIAESVAKEPASSKRITRSSVSIAAAVICVLFAVLVSKCFKDALDDVRYLYSDAENTARFINTEMDADDIIVANSEDSCNSVIPYLSADRTIYNPFSKEPAGYVLRDASKPHELTYEQFLDNCREMFPDQKEVYILFSKENRIDDALLEKMEQSEPVYQTAAENVIRGEEYTIFLLSLS